MLPGQTFTPLTAPDSPLTCPITTARRLYDSLAAPIGCRTTTHDRYIQGAIRHAVPEADWMALHGVARYAPPDRPPFSSVNDVGETLSNILEHYRYLLPIVMDRMIAFKLKNQAREIAQMHDLMMPADARPSALVDALYAKLSAGALPGIEQRLLTREDIFTAHVIAAVELKESLRTEAALLRNKAVDLLKDEFHLDPITANLTGADDYLKQAQALLDSADRISLPSGSFAYHVGVTTAMFSHKIFGEDVFRPLSIAAHRLNDVGTDREASHTQRLSINSSLRKIGFSAAAVCGALTIKTERPFFLMAGISIAGAAYAFSKKMDTQENELYKGHGIQSFDAWAANQLEDKPFDLSDLPNLKLVRSQLLKNIIKITDKSKDAMDISILNQEDMEHLSILCRHFDGLTRQIALLELRPKTPEEHSFISAMSAYEKRSQDGQWISREGLTHMLSDIEAMGLSESEDTRAHFSAAILP